MRLVIIESPYAGDVARNVAYARACLADSLKRGEAPIASHLLYTQPGVLDDNVPDQRALGIEAGLAWRKVADAAVFYTDLGWSNGMLAAQDAYATEGVPYYTRQLDGFLGIDRDHYERTFPVGKEGTDWVGMPPCKWVNGCVDKAKCFGRETCGNLDPVDRNRHEFGQVVGRALRTAPRVPAGNAVWAMSRRAGKTAALERVAQSAERFRDVAFGDGVQRHTIADTLAKMSPEELEAVKVPTLADPLAAGRAPAFYQGPSVATAEQLEAGGFKVVATSGCEHADTYTMRPLYQASEVEVCRDCGEQLGQLRKVGTYAGMDVVVDPAMAPDEYRIVQAGDIGSLVFAPGEEEKTIATVWPAEDHQGDADAGLTDAQVIRRDWFGETVD